MRATVLSLMSGQLPVCYSEYNYKTAGYIHRSSVRDLEIQSLSPLQFGVLDIVPALLLRHSVPDSVAALVPPNVAELSK